MPFSIDQLKLAAWRIFQGFMPREKPKALYIPLDFSAVGSDGADIDIDLTLVKQEAQFDIVQSVFIDNTLSGVEFTLTENVTQHSVTVEAGQQGYLPLFSTDAMKFTGSTASNVANGVVKVQFLNMPLPAFVWPFTINNPNPPVIWNFVHNPQTGQEDFVITENGITAFALYAPNPPGLATPVLVFGGDINTPSAFYFTGGSGGGQFGMINGPYFQFTPDTGPNGANDDGFVDLFHNDLTHATLNIGDLFADNTVNATAGITAGPGGNNWQTGDHMVGAVVLDATSYIAINVNGNSYKLLIST